MQRDFTKGLRAAVPILIGYLPIAMTFGLIARNMDIGLPPACGMSLLVFAGASQFMALNMIMNGMAVSEILIATLLVNFRHFLMSASLATKLSAGARFRAVIAFWISDETFAVASGQRDRVSGPYLLGLEGLAYVSWACGTAIGHLIGHVLPDAIQKGMGISLYALFIAILVLGVRQSLRAGLVALVAAGAHLLFGLMRSLPSGWSIIFAVVVGSAVGAFVFREEDQA